MKQLVCKWCNEDKFFALETVHAKTPVAFYGERDQRNNLTVEIEETGAGQFIHDDATSVVTAYLCANGNCNKVTVPTDFALNLKESDA